MGSWEEDGGEGEEEGTAASCWAFFHVENTFCFIFFHFLISLMYVFSQHLLNVYYVSGTVPSGEDTTKNRTISYLL